MSAHSGGARSIKYKMYMIKYKEYSTKYSRGASNGEKRRPERMIDDRNKTGQTGQIRAAIQYTVYSIKHCLRAEDDVVE